MRQILLAGAADQVASMLRPNLAKRYALRLSDCKAPEHIAGGETFIIGADLADFDKITNGPEA